MRPDEYDLTQYGVGSVLKHSTNPSVWVRFEDGWQNPVGLAENTYDDAWATRCFNSSYADWVIRVEAPKPAVELPVEPTLGYLRWSSNTSGTREVLAQWSTVGPHSNSPGKHVFSDLGHVIHQKIVTAFDPVVAVPADALAELRRTHQSDWERQHCPAIARFLAAVDEANGAGE